MGNSSTKPRKAKGTVAHKPGLAAVSLTIRTSEKRCIPLDTTINFVLHGDTGSSDVLTYGDLSHRITEEKSEIIPLPGLDASSVRVLEFWCETDDPEELLWFLLAIEIVDRKMKRTITFPVGRWILPGFRYALQEGGVQLPQQQANGDERQDEIELIAQYYQPVSIYPNLPAQIISVPRYEIYRDTPRQSLRELRDDLYSRSDWLLDLARDDTPWRNVEEFGQLFREPEMPYPLGVMDWIKDSKFGHQRICGLNAAGLRLCTTLPDNLRLTAEEVEPFLEGWRLDMVLQAKRLLILDLSIMDGLKDMDGNLFPAPIALFYRDGNKQITPIAIQLFPRPGPDNPIFFPTDSPYTWLLAKLWLNLADTSYALASEYIWLHISLENVALHIHTSLSPSHPLYKLLFPHFAHVFSTNRNILSHMIERDGYLDQCTSLGADGFLQLARRCGQAFRLDLHGNPAKWFHEAGTLPDMMVPCYYYRMDMLQLNRCLEGYVRVVVKQHYRDSLAVQHDTELQTFLSALIADSDRCGMNLRGITQLTQPEHVIQFASALIYCATVKQSYFANCVYDNIGFPAVCPLILCGAPPRTKTPLAEADVIRQLPSRQIAIETVLFAKILSSSRKNKLGNFGKRMFYDQVSVSAQKQLRENLAVWEADLAKQLEERVYPFPYLLPSSVAENVVI